MKKGNINSTESSILQREKQGGASLSKKTKPELLSEVKKLLKEVDLLKKNDINLLSTFIQTTANEVLHEQDILNELKQNEEKFRALSMASSEGLFIHQKGVILEVNQTLCEMFGYSESEIVGHPLFDFISKKSMAQTSNHIKTGYQKPYETECIKKNGEIFTCETTAKEFIYKGKLTRAVALRDISELKRVGEEIKQSRENYKSLVDDSPDGIFIHDEGKVIFANSSAFRIMEINSFDELKNKTIFDFVLSDYHGPIKERMQVLNSPKYQPFREMKVRTAKGNIIELESQAVRIKYNGKEATQVILHKTEPEKLLVKEQLRAQVAEETNQKLQQEIAERKITERMLQNTQKFTRLLIDSSLDMICASDRNGNIIEFNQAAQKIFGYQLHEVIGKPVDILFEDALDGINEIGESGKKINFFREQVIGEVISVKKNGEKFVSFLSSSFLKNEEGELIGAMGVFRDISDIKKTIEELRENEERYRAIYEQAFIGIAEVGLKGDFIRVNDQLCNIVGYTKEELCRKSFIEITVPEDIQKSIDYRLKLIHGDSNKTTFEKKYIHKNGQIIHINITLSLLRNGNGSPLYFIAVFQDITERIKIEQERQAQSAKLKSIFESSSHIIWTIDNNFCLTSFNKNFVTNMQRWSDLNPFIGFSFLRSHGDSSEEYDKYWIIKFTQAFNGHPQYFETSLKDKDHNLVWREIYLNPIIDDKGKIIEVSGIAHDITEKKHSEEKIRQSLEEKEVLLKEVHHRVKNNLQVISSILNLQSSYVKDEGTLNILKESQNRIKSMSFIHESLYQTLDFSSINFKEYVKNLSENLIHSYSNLDHEITLNLDIQNVFLNLDLAIPCGLIINEIISNALKYAFDDESEDGEITIKMKSDGDNLILFIGDNGIGLPQNIDFRKTESLGLQLVVTLTAQLSGTIELDKQKKGANFIIIFNKNQGKNRI